MKVRWSAWFTLSMRPAYSPTRAYAFDTDFLDLSKLPPGTPKFRDVVNVGFQQVY